jgi:dTDP-glucose pyrophosphorylase
MVVTRLLIRGDSQGRRANSRCGSTDTVTLPRPLRWRRGRVKIPPHETEAKTVKAVILAAGKGTRMKELTNEVPKPMLRVQCKPILEHIIAGLITAGVREIFIVTGWKAEVIEEHFGNGAPFGVRIAYGRQAIQDGTGRAPELAKDFVSASPFILTYGDILVKPETYQRMVQRFQEGAFAGVVTVTGSEDVTKGGLFFFDEKLCLRHLVEKPSAAQLSELQADGWLKPGAPAWYNAGIYIFQPSLFEFTAKLKPSPRGEYELTDAISALIAAKRVLAGLEIQGRWVDVRDPEVLASLEKQSI